VLAWRGFRAKAPPLPAKARHPGPPMRRAALVPRLREDGDTVVLGSGHALDLLRSRARTSSEAVLHFITDLGDSAVLLPVAALVLIYLLLKRQPRAAGLWFMAVLLCALFALAGPSCHCLMQCDEVDG